MKSERLQRTDSQQLTLEAEFKRVFPYLYQLAQNRRPDDNWPVKAAMVPHLERGIEKMEREAELSRYTTSSSLAGTHGVGSSSGSADKMYGKSNAQGSASGPPQYTRYPDEVNDAGGKEYARKEAEDSHDYYYHKQRHLDVWQGAGPALHKSMSSSTLKGQSPDELDVGGLNTTTSNPTAAAMGTATASGFDKRGRSSSGGGKNLFSRLIRSGRPDAPSSR